MGFFTSKLDDMTSSQLQRYAMKYAEENNMSDAAATKLFGPKIKEKQAEEAKGKKKTEMKKGGMPKKDKVPVITIGVGMAEFPKGKNKPHNYFAGGSVKMNPGLKALKKASPEAYNNIMKNK